MNSPYVRGLLKELEQALAHEDAAHSRVGAERRRVEQAEAELEAARLEVPKHEADVKIWRNAQDDIRARLREEGFFDD